MFSISNVPNSRDPIASIPAGIYRATIIDLELRRNKETDGTHFMLTYATVFPSEFAGTKLSDNFNFQNPNPVAVEIGKSKLADVMFTIQVQGFSNIEEFKQKTIGKELLIETELEEDSKGNLWPRIADVWSLGGKHRNDRRSVKSPELGPNGKPPKSRKGKPVQSNSNSNSKSSFDDTPF